MAIGADRVQILGLILRQAAAFSITGIAAGLLIALLSARLLSSLLFETTPTDALSLAMSIAALVLVTLVAVSIPSARAASVNPVEALRSE